MRKIDFEKINKKNVFFAITEPKIIQKKIVIMSHGFRSSSLGPARTFVDFEKILNDNGISSLRFDQPCSGNSEGEYLNSSFKEWINTTTFFTKKYLNLGYQVVLLGQSMGATNTMAVTAQDGIKDRIPCILLWVPDPKSTLKIDFDKTYEEDGQKYQGKFWKEAQDSHFFDCLNSYEGGIHLVYGEKDKYISKKLRSQVIQKVKNKNQPVMILKNQDHSPWEYDIAQEVFSEELNFIQKYFS